MIISYGMPPFGQDLWNSRRCLSKIEGFDHSVVNSTLGACGELPAGQESPCLPCFIWQCGNVRVINQNSIFSVEEFYFVKVRFKFLF